MGTSSGVIICAALVSLSYGSPMSPTYDTIIIGAGPAGTSAASTLAKAGKRVLVLEAQNRIGGRVNTVPFGDGLVELGAEWIHGTVGSPVYELALKNNVSIIPQDLTFKVYNSDGSSDRETIVQDLINFALKVVDEPPKDPEPLGQYITRRTNDYIKINHPSVQNDTEFLNSFFEFMDLVIDNYESSNSWNDVTTESKYTELDGNQHMSWHTNGYKTLFEILLNTYKNGPGYPNLEIKLDTEVTKIQWPQDPKDNVVVTVKDGTTYSSKTAIITVSVGVLKERSATLFSPQLPEEKLKPINFIPMGLLDKVDLHFSEPWWSFPGQNFNFFWDGDKKRSFVGEDRWVTQIVSISNPLGAKNVMTVWLSGDRAKYNSLFSPSLPVAKSRAIEAIPFGVCDKIILRFAQPWWDADGCFLWRSVEKNRLSEADSWMSKMDGASVPMAFHSALVLWACGDAAKTVETLPEDVVKAKTMSVIRLFMGAGKTIPEPVEMLRSNWYSNPFTRGSYSYDGLQTPSYPSARADLAAPLADSAGAPRLLFAGEASHSIHFSTVHGAVETGRREAERLLSTPSKI